MFQNHIIIRCSATNQEQLKNALLMIVDKIKNNDISTVLHDDFNFSFELFDSETLKIFDIDPNEFMYVDLPSNL